MKKKTGIRISLLAVVLSAVCAVSPLSARALVILPENQEELFDRPTAIAVVEVKHTQEKTLRDPLDAEMGLDIEVTNHISKVTVRDVIKGELSPGDQITIMQENIEDEGDPLQEGERWLLFLSAVSDKAKEYYSKYGLNNLYRISRAIGQYKLDEENTITQMTVFSRDLLGDVETVEDIRILCESMGIYPTPPSPEKKLHDLLTAYWWVVPAAMLLFAGIFTVCWGKSRRKGKTPSGPPGDDPSGTKG